MYYNFKKDVNDLPNLMTEQQIKNLKPNPKENHFISVFRYNDEHKKQWEQNKSLAGIKDSTTDILLWDFDSVDLEASRKNALELCTRLVDNYGVPPEDIYCAFSGSKGYHVKINLDHEINPKQFRQAVMEIGKDLDLDPTVTHAQCMIRVENTVNQKSGLYKIPLSVFELDEMTSDQIKELAKQPRHFDMSYNSVKLPEALFKTKEKENTLKVDSSEFNSTNIPKGWKPYKWALAQGFFDSGERHQALMVLAATGRGLGYDRETTYYLCKSALKKQAARSGNPEFPKEELWENIVESVFSDRWEGGQYSPENNAWLKKYCQRMNFDVEHKEELVQLHNIQAEFIDFVKNIDKNTILTGIPELDQKLPLTVGMNLGIIGAPASGKTALCLKILKNTSDAGVISVFASLDMRRNRLYEKLLYRVSGLSRKELYEKINNNEAGPIFDQVREEYKNVFFYDRSCPSVGDIRNYIVDIEEKTGKKVKLVMIDYFERINSDRSEETAASKDIAGKLQDLVNDFNVCLITLVQPNKFSLSGGPDSPILNYTSIKGSSYLYQAFRSIVSLWRPFAIPELKHNDKFLQMAILKNDLGELDMFNFGWDGRRGEIWGLAEEGEDELEKLLKEKSERNQKEKDWE